MFRGAEAIMKYFNGYYKEHRNDDELSQSEGKHHRIKKRNAYGIPVIAYYLHDWVFISKYFNAVDRQEIKNLYDIARFKENDFEKAWKHKRNYEAKII